MVKFPIHTVKFKYKTWKTNYVNLKKHLLAENEYR